MPKIIEITDFSAKELDPYARLTEAELKHFYEPCGGLFIAESPKVIERALNAGCEPVSLLLEKSHISGEAKDIVSRCNDIPVYTAEFDVLTKLTGFKLTRGALCLMKRPKLSQLKDVCLNAKRVAVLENVMNPTNVGAIFRSAAALGMDAVLLTDGCSDPLYRRASRVSMGTVFQVQWTFAGADWTVQLSELGFKTAAMALDDNSVSIDEPALLKEEKLAVVLGTEGDGLAEKTITSCDYTVKIPMSHEVDSLNVAAASAVAFWQLGKR
ncbi:MAG: RNA methyltransferase [Oscillospiraceae bacterium]|nr:RNA methyltransferase [Oscillospiraceae bacterium]